MRPFPGHWDLLLEQELEQEQPVRLLAPLQVALPGMVEREPRQVALLARQDKPELLQAAQVVRHTRFVARAAPE